MENKTMMKLVVGTEGMFFVALIMAFIYMAYNSGFEPYEVSKLDIKTTGLFTIVLFSSSFTFWMAEKKYRNGDIKSLKIWLIITILFGSIFLFGQGEEYMRLINANITLSGSVFGTSFYALTGFHGLHVFIGLIILLIILILVFLGDFNNTSSNVISTVGIYWHFVDIVWMFVFTVVYVLPKFTKI
ncbi:MAG: heme-copper oxidase subunit III [Bacteroidota bacterium]|nr:heme-copper oxidase subunit III [Bacteroidota bacterium]